LHQCRQLVFECFVFEKAEFNLNTGVQFLEISRCLFPDIDDFRVGLDIQNLDASLSSGRGHVNQEESRREENREEIFHGVWG
jgi:hypothetical protein